jgi:radical SAM protein with 4Fe4S-binding SPASM domain
MSPAPLVIVPQSFGSLVFERRSGRYHAMDRAATALLERARHASVFELVGQLPQAERGPAGSLVRGLYARGWFDLDGRLAGVRLQAEPPVGHLLGPLMVHLELLGLCNLTCDHCFAAPLPRKDRLSLPELDTLFGQLAAMGSFRLGLTGGEPLMRPDLLEVVDAALAHGLQPRLTTNGLLIDEALARALGQRPELQINVSLEGATAASSDAVRGEGTFERVLQRLALLREHARFALAFTVTARNHAEVEACAALARRVGAQKAVFRPLYPVGAAAARPELMPTFDAYTGALLRLAGDAPGSSGAGCGAGSLEASISAEGEVSPCSFLGPGFASGNVRLRPFREIWDEGHRFRELRDPDRSGRDGFRGGCRARAQAATGSAFGPDPWQEAWEADQAGHLPPLCGVERQCAG